MQKPRRKRICGGRSRRRRAKCAATTRLVCEGLEGRKVLAASLVLSGPTQVVFEGERAHFTLALSEPLATAETIAITVAGGTATLGRDFFSPSVTRVVFGPGQTTKSFFVPTLRDPGSDAAEGVESFQVVVSPVSRHLAARRHVVQITDFVPMPKVSVADVAVVEGNQGPTLATFVVSLATAYPRPVSVEYATRDESATTEDTDYVTAAGVLSFAPGERSKSITVSVAGDRKAELDETFRLVLSNPVNGVLAKAEGVATIRNDEVDQPGFQITLEFVTSAYGQVPANVRTAAAQAVQRWQRVIIGDIPGMIEESTGVFVDDFRMRFKMGLLGEEPSDGQGSILASAMPLQYRAAAPGLPWLGETGIDPADVNRADLVGVLVHEIGHALGFGRSNPGFQRWVADSGWVGPNAVREYASIFRLPGATAVPLEPGGTAHWAENVFGNEMLTPYIDAVMPLSRVTVGAFADLGYQVSYAAADIFVPPPSVSPPATPNRPATSRIGGVLSPTNPETSTPLGQQKRSPAAAVPTGNQRTSSLAARTIVVSTAQRSAGRVLRTESMTVHHGALRR